MLIDILDYKNALASKKYKENPKRRYPVQQTDDPLLINPFISDEAKISNSKAYRRLAGKPQVFPIPINSSVRTRLIHTEEAISDGLVPGSFLGLNCELIRSGLKGHDIGHCAFGHDGERVIDAISKERGEDKEFEHAIMGVVTAQQIERKDGIGLNLTYPTLQCMLYHSNKNSQLTVNPELPLECALVMYADKISYTFADINDAVRMDRLDKSQLRDYFDFRKTHRNLTNQCICALIKESAEEGTISFEKSETAKSFLALRKWMYQNVYSKIGGDFQDLIMRKDYEFFSEDRRFKNTDPLIMLALLSDAQATYLADTIRSSRPVKDHVLQESGIFEVRNYIRGKKIDFTDPDLNKEDFIY